MKTAIVVLACARIAAAQVAVTVGIDTSRSEAAVWAEAQTEAKQIVEALPDGTHATIFTLGGNVRRVFDGGIDAERRVEALRQLDAARPVESNTDLAAAIAEGIASMNGIAGRRIFVLISDCRNMPERKSPYRGKSFAQVLSGVKLPERTEMFVRAMSDEPTPARVGIGVLRTPPDWSAILRLKAPALPQSPAPAPDFHRWAIAAFIVAGLLASGGVAVWRRRNSEPDSGDLEAAVELPRESEPLVRTRERLLYKVERRGASDSISLGLEGRMAVSIGDDPLADIGNAGDLGALARLEMAQGRVVLLNAGRAPVWVGRREIGPGRRQVLPVGGAEIGLGRDIFEVYPETVLETVEAN